MKKILLASFFTSTLLGCGSNSENDTGSDTTFDEPLMTPSSSNESTMTGFWEGQVDFTQDDGFTVDRSYLAAIFDGSGTGLAYDYQKDRVIVFDMATLVADTNFYLSGNQYDAVTKQLSDYTLEGYIIDKDISSESEINQGELIRSDLLSNFDLQESTLPELMGSYTDGIEGSNESMTIDETGNFIWINHNDGCSIEGSIASRDNPTAPYSIVAQASGCDIPPGQYRGLLVTGKNLPYARAVNQVFWILTNGNESIADFVYN